MVTGCEDEDFDVLYQSEVLGDNIFSTKDGHPVFIEVTEEEFNHEYFDDYMVGRSRRSVDEEYDAENYYTDYEGVPNLNLDEQFPISGDLLFDKDIDMPEELILNVNIYLDPEWKKLHKNDSFKKAKQVLAEASQLFQHHSLRTKIELVHNSRIFDSDKHMRINKIVMGKIEKQLKYPFEVEGTYNNSREYKVAHVYFTAGKMYFNGRATQESICDEVKHPIAVIRWLDSISRTATTTAHEIGHVLGMWHDFNTGPDTRSKCHEKGKGIHLMNYNMKAENGKQRGQWSKCSNEDFIHYYERVFGSTNDFCLEVKPTNCVWSGWSTYSSCSLSCGGGLQFANRTVAQQATNGGKECSGEAKKSQKCGESECPFRLVTIIVPVTIVIIFLILGILCCYIQKQYSFTSLYVKTMDSISTWKQKQSTDIQA